MSDLKLTDCDRQLYQERLIKFTVYSQKVRMENAKKLQKKFEIICNHGSLEGPANEDVMLVLVEAVNIEAARQKFYADQTTQMYGRSIRSIREKEA